MARSIQQPAFSEPIAVVPASPECWTGLVALFASSKGRSGCWCAWPRRARGGHRPDDPENREALRARVFSGNPPGLVAFSGRRAVGWCAVGRRAEYPQYEGESRGDVWAIPCLSLDDAVRGSGVARTLIESAVAYATAHGASIIEGPPPYWLAGPPEVVAAAKEAFSSCGFVEVAPGARMPALRFYVNAHE